MSEHPPATAQPSGHNPPAPPPSAPPPSAPPSSATAGRAIDGGKGRVFPCPQCGGELVFNIGDQHLKCAHCGFEKEIVVPKDAAVVEQDFRAMLAQLEKGRDSRAESQKQEEQQNHVRCESCGATVVFIDTLTSLECPYCGAPIEREHIHTGGWRIPVDGVLPFLFVRERAADSFSKWIGSRWFAPNGFSKRAEGGKFNGVYLPFWTFDAVTASRYRGQRGDHYYETVGSGDNRRQEQRTRWSSASGNFQRVFDDILVVATHALRRDLVDGLAPWPLQRCIPFRQEVLAGFLARTYDVELKDGFGEAQSYINGQIESETRSRIGGDEQVIDDIQTAYGAVTFKHLLLPVWLMAYRYRDRTYQILVNATTGELDGERPYSPWKIAAAIIAGALLTIGLIFLANHR